MSTQQEIISLLDQAVKMHQANRLKEAENLYKKVLDKANPLYWRACHKWRKMYEHIM